MLNRLYAKNEVTGTITNDMLDWFEARLADDAAAEEHDMRLSLARCMSACQRMSAMVDLDLREYPSGDGQELERLTRREFCAVHCVAKDVHQMDLPIGASTS